MNTKYLINNKKKSLRNYKIIYFLFFSLFIFSCKPDEPVPPPVTPPVTPATTADLTFKFHGVYNNTPVNWNSFYKTLAGDTVKFAKIKYIFSNFILEKNNGDLVKIADAYGFITLSENVDSFIFKNVPIADYKSLRIQVGLDQDINHGNPAQWGLNHPLNPSVNDMHWGWSGGYIFNVVEGYFKNNGSDMAYSFHVALDKNVRNNLMNYNYSISKNGKFNMNVNLDKIFSNAINFSLKTDGSFSHSGDTDAVMDKFLQNANGVLSIQDFK